mgnify:CR=1 FL=1
MEQMTWSSTIISLSTWQKKVKAVCGEDRVELDLFENEPHGSQVIKADQNIEKCIDFLDKHFYEGKNPYRKPLGKIRIVGENEDK